MTAAADRFAYAIGRLRHLYAQMTDGQVTNTVEAASGILGPVIADLEVETGEVSAEVERLSRELQQAVGGEPAPGVLTKEQIDAIRADAEDDLKSFIEGGELHNLATWTLALLSDHAKLEREFVVLKKHSDVVDERLEALTKERDALSAEAMAVTAIVVREMGCENTIHQEDPEPFCAETELPLVHWCPACQIARALGWSFPFDEEAALAAARSTPGGGR